MSDRVVSITDSIAEGGSKTIAPATTPPPEIQTPPDNPHPTHISVESKELKIAELVEKLGKTRQAIESARDKGTLADFGYKADKNGRNWFYYPLE